MEVPFDVDLNFLEREILNVFRDKQQTEEARVAAKPYLPFLAKCYQKDLAILLARPKYFLAEIENFLALYAFLYVAQMALNVKEWRNGEPKSKPMYFILDKEKASQERCEIHELGPNQLFGKLLQPRAAESLFPNLSMLELLNKGSESILPLWELAANIAGDREDPKLIATLELFTREFIEKRQLLLDPMGSNDALQWLEILMTAAEEQFDKQKHRTSERPEHNDRFVGQIRERIAAPFIQNRKRGGNVFVLNQDQLILLTNLCIGNRDRLRFHELTQSFRERGVYFDKLSDQRLISFYERIGNVERLSDSGDAVYVKKTI